MSIFNEFPYTNFHEMNLDWILNKMKELAAEWLSVSENWKKWIADTDAAFEDLKAFVTDYFDNLDLLEEVSQKLDEMVQDGTLEHIINEEVLNGVQSKIENMYPTENERELYKDMIRKNLVSYLIRNNFSSCFRTGEAIADAGYKTVFKYFIGKTYMGMYGAGSFVYNDVETVNGQDYKVAYFDCTTFTSIITRGIPFESSPYAYAFSHDDATVDDMYFLGLENMDPKKNYTFDCLNNLKTVNAARVMNNSGNTLQLVGTLPDRQIYPDVIDKLETGDILWCGSESHRPASFKHIYHCGVFVKDLAELDALAAQHGITFQAADGVESQYGYIVEVWSHGDTLYADKLIIHSLEYWLDNIVEGTDQQIYMTKGFANSMNSNKQYSLVSGMYRLYDEIRPVNTVSEGSLSFPATGARFNINTFNSMAGGQPFQLNNIDIDTMNKPEHSGLWKTYNSTDLGSITGDIPRSGSFFHLIVFGGSASGRGAVQIFVTITQTQNARDYIFIRETGPNSDVYGEWVPIFVHHRMGTITPQAIPANSHVAVPITFDKPLPMIAHIQITPFISGESAQYGSTGVAVSGNSTTGFTAHFYNNAPYQAALGAFWLAY